ncbi:alternative mRNA splicing, via spliceosome, partial [Rhizoctonia solani]
MDNYDDDINKHTDLLYKDNKPTGDHGAAAEPSSESRDPNTPTGPTTDKKRKLIVCIDGTANQFSDKNTNVVEMYRYIKKDESQLTYYNSGIGTFAKPSWRSWSYYKQVLYHNIDLAIAWNLEKTIIGAYRWLSDIYKPGDQIFLFGFSRGAYQVRALAAMIESVGLIYAGNQEQIPFAWELYASHQPNDSRYEPRIFEFKQTFSHDSVDIHFIGVWDTVSSIGFFRRNPLPLTNVCDHVTHFRHALALDERRVKFDAEYVQVSPGRSLKGTNSTLKEVWFAGTHSDIGGGNEQNLNLLSGTVPLRWMMEEAKNAGLVLKPTHQYVRVDLAYVTNVRITNSMKYWWFMEYFIPFSWYLHTPEKTGRTYGLHWGRGRTVLPRQKLHWTVGVNYEDSVANGYHPEALLVDKNGKPALWKIVFEAFSLKDIGPMDIKNSRDDAPEWEGDKDLVETLHIMKQFNRCEGFQQKHSWLKKLSKGMVKSDNSNTVWVYGGTSFLKEIAVVCGDNHIGLARDIIKRIIGFQDSVTDIDVIKTIFLRLNDVVPLCKYSIPINPHKLAAHSPQTQGFMAFFERLKSIISTDKTLIAPNKVLTLYSIEFTSIIMELIRDLSRTKEYVNKMFLAANLSIIESLLASIPPDADEVGTLIPIDKVYRTAAIQVVEALVPFANHDKGRQKLLNGGITKKLLPLLEIQDDDLIFQIMHIFRVLSKGEVKSSLSLKLAQPIVKLLKVTTLSDKTVEEILKTLVLLAPSGAFDEVFDNHALQRLIYLMKDHSQAIEAACYLTLYGRFRNSLTQQPIADIIQDLLRKDEKATTEEVVRLVSIILSLSGTGSPEVKLIDPASLVPLLNKAPLSYELLESLLTIVPRYPKEFLSSGFLDYLILTLQSGKLTAMAKSETILVLSAAISGAIDDTAQSLRARDFDEETGLPKDVDFAEATELAGEEFLVAAQSLVSILVRLIPHATGNVTLEALRAISRFLKQDNIVTNTDELVRLVVWMLNQVHQMWYGRSEIFGLFFMIEINVHSLIKHFQTVRKIGYLYDEILWEVFQVLVTEESRELLLELGAYKFLFLLADAPSYVTRERVLTLLKNLREDINDDKLNAELDNCSKSSHDPGAAAHQQWDTPGCNSTSRYVAAELAEHTRGLQQSQFRYQAFYTMSFKPARVRSNSM